MKTVTEHLLALADAGNAAFTARLAPGVDPDRILGCRIPQLRRLARTLRGTPEAAAFLTQLPHRYYDENNLHGILLGHIRPTGEALDALERHHILRVLEYTKGNKAEAARLLGIGIATLYRKLESYGMKP